MFRLTLSLLVPLLLLGCATANKPDESREQLLRDFDTGEDNVVVPSTFGSSTIEDWRYVDEYTMIIETSQYGKLVATFMMPCRGLRYAEVIGFNTMGPFDLDRTTTVHLPDGTTCRFKELKRYISLESDAAEGAAE